MGRWVSGRRGGAGALSGPAQPGVVPEDGSVFLGVPGDILSLLLSVAGGPGRAAPAGWAVRARVPQPPRPCPPCPCPAGLTPRCAHSLAESLATKQGE